MREKKPCKGRDFCRTTMEKHSNRSNQIYWACGCFGPNNRSNKLRFQSSAECVWLTHRKSCHKAGVPSGMNQYIPAKVTIGQSMCTPKCFHDDPTARKYKWRTNKIITCHAVNSAMNFPKSVCILGNDIDVLIQMKINPRLRSLMRNIKQKEKNILS